MSALILIVDDAADTRSMLARFAEIEGYRSQTAASGEEALLALETARPDLILLDAVMPGLDGFVTCRRIKARDATAHIPVVFMTGLSETEHVILGLSAGGVDYVTKPLVIEELAARIRVHIANARTTRSAMSALGSAGSLLFSCDSAARIGWATPEAQRLLDGMDLPGVEDLRILLRDLLSTAANGSATFISGSLKFVLGLIGPSAPGEYLFKLERSTEGMETVLFQQAFGLTPREADVLLWTARGKSNKDMSEILNISARTVNKHLEQIFIKVGVENRASAAALATRIILQG